jgi:outer membrane lipoprotein SlyB
MENSDTAESVRAAGHRPGLLYPLMLIAAIAVIVFSLAGTATIMGWLPDARSRAVEDRDADGRAAAPPAAQNPVRSALAGRCSDCGVIESIRAVEVKGQGSGLGAVAGGVVGGVLGNQIGRGNGRAAATVVGAGAGAYAGHEIEKSVNNTVSYQVRVRMNDGTYRTLNQRAQPTWRVGQKVRVNDRGIIAAG